MSYPIRQQIQTGLYILSYYQREMEKLLSRGQENLSDKIRQTLGSECSLELVNPIVARDFPRHLRYSFISLLVSFAESQLQDLSVEVGRRKKLSAVSVKDFLGGLEKIKKSKDFLKNYLADDFSDTTRKGFLQSMDELYDPVLFLVKVRNCILHSAGDISKLKRTGDQQELQKGKRKYAGFNITDQTIELEEIFCKVAAKAVEKLFANLFAILP